MKNLGGLTIIKLSTLVAALVIVTGCNPRYEPRQGEKAAGDGTNITTGTPPGGPTCPGAPGCPTVTPTCPGSPGCPVGPGLVKIEVDQVLMCGSGSRDWMSLYTTFNPKKPHQSTPVTNPRLALINIKPGKLSGSVFDDAFNDPYAMKNIYVGGHSVFHENKFEYTVDQAKIDALINNKTDKQVTVALLYDDPTMAGASHIPTKEQIFGRPHQVKKTSGYAFKVRTHLFSNVGQPACSAIQDPAEKALCMERCQRMFDPMIVDLNNDGLKMVNKNKGFELDTTGDGQTEKVGWVADDSADDGVLFYDSQEKNKKIDSGLELFSEMFQYTLGGEVKTGFFDGFDALEAFAGGKVVDPSNTVYWDLLLKYGNGDVKTLPEAGIHRIDLTNAEILDASFSSNLKGNQATRKAWVILDNGKQVPVYDVWLD